MKHLYRILPVGCMIASWGLVALTGCEGGDIFEVDSPDWLSEVVDSIANSGTTTEDDGETLEGQMEDVYTFGETDYSSSFWSSGSFSKYYVVPDGEKWEAVLNLHINPDDNTYYKNMFIVVTSDDDRSGSDYSEYGVWRYDATTDTVTYNSQWGNYLYFKYTSCNNYMSPVDNEDALLQSMNGKVTVTVDRTDPDAFFMSFSNSSITKTYNQPYALPNLNSDETNTNIRCFIGVEGAYIDWVSTNIEPIGGCTSSQDKEPLTIELENVPDQVSIGTTLDSIVADITATITYEEEVTGTVTSDDLNFTLSGSLEETGTVTLVATYNKTINGNTAEVPAVAIATIEVVEKVVALEITAQPTYTTYYYYTSEATQGITRPDFSFGTTGLEVTATYANGATKVIDNSKLSFTTVPSTVGTHTVTISCSDGPTTTTTVSVVEATSATALTNSETTVGATDYSSGFWTAFTDDFVVAAGETKSISFTNYAGTSNWSNFVVALRKADYSVEYAVVRADNYGWDDGYNNCTLSGGQSDWAAWLADMAEAQVTVYVTNCANGSADVQAVMIGSSGTTYIQYYLGLDTIDPDDLTFMITIDGCYLVF